MSCLKPTSDSEMKEKERMIKQLRGNRRQHNLIIQTNVINENVKKRGNELQLYDIHELKNLRFSDLDMKAICYCLSLKY